MNTANGPAPTALNYLKGVCMGAADVVPGVSGGTMALILGIYQRLLLAIRSFDLELLDLLRRGQIAAAARHVDLALLIPLGLGIISAILFFTRVVSIPLLLNTQPEAIYGLFFGLIVASIVVLMKDIGMHSAADAGWALLGLLAGLLVVNLVPVSTPDAAWFIFASGALAICAMILPGISGSFILLILQKYAYVFDAIGRFQLGIIVPFGLGAITGLLLFSRVLSALLARCYRQTLLTICGILAGSLWVIWPFQARTFVTVRDKERLVASDPIWPGSLDSTVVWALVLAAIGFVTVLILHRIGKTRAAVQPQGAG